MIKRIITVFLAFVMLISLFACTVDENYDADTSENVTETEETSNDASSRLPISLLGEYTFIFPQKGVSKELTTAANDLKSLLEKIGGAELGFRDDFIYKGKFEVEEHEILIGNTNREESALVYSDLKKYNDYEVRLCGSKIVIAGMNDQQLVEAVNGIIDAIKAIPDGADYFFVGATMQTRFIGTYAVDEMLLGDYSISEYSIVYKSSSFYEKMADAVYQSILSTVGYKLPLVRDINVDDTTKKIIIGNTKFGAPDGVDTTVSSQYAISAKGADVYIYATDNIALYDAVCAFTEQISSSKGARVLIDPDIGAVTLENDAMTTMSFNLLVSNITTERKARVVGMIEKYMPDTFGVQEANSTWISTLEKELGDVYAHVGIGRDKNGTGERSSVFYKKDKFELLDSGTKWMSSTPDVVSKVSGSICNRVFSYALLKCKSDGKQFMHINVHTDHASDENVRFEQIKVLMAFVKLHSDKAIIITGDFNSQKGTTTINHVLSMVEDSSDIALVSQKAPTFSTKIIDYIFVTSGDFEVYEYWVDNSMIDGEYPSDHFPILMKYKLK